MDNQKKEIRIDGKWQVVRKFATGDPGGQSLTLYKDYIIEFATGGIFVETHGDKITTTSYHFDAGSGTIEILSAGYTQPTPLFGPGNTLFRIVPLNDREMYLRSPHSVETDGNFESLLLKRMQM